MTTFNKKVFKNLPFSIKVRKSRYYYQDILDNVNENVTKDITLTKFEGLDYEIDRGFLSFSRKELWNGKISPSYNGILVPYDYYMSYDPNIDVVGDLVFDNGVVSGFSSSNYVYLSDSYKKDNNATYIIKFTTGENISSKQCVVHSEGFLRIEMLGSSFQVDGNSVLQVSPNTTYWWKCEINGTTRTWSYSLDGIDYTQISTLNYSGNTSSTYQIRFGISSYQLTDPFYGSIDFSGTSIKVGNDMLWQYDPLGTEIPAEYLTTKSGLAYSIVGNPVIENNVLKNTENTNYIIPNGISIAVGSSSWEYTMKIKTHANALSNEHSFIDLTSDAYGVRVGTAATNLGRWQILVKYNDNWVNVGSHAGSHSVQSDTIYWIKAGYDKTTNTYYLKYSTNGTDYVNDISYNANNVLNYLYVHIGKTWYDDIYLDECTLVVDGTEVWGENGRSVTFIAGCLDEGTTTSPNLTRTYNLFADKTKVLVSENSEDKDGYTWAGEIEIGPILYSKVYKPNYDVAGIISYDTNFNVSGFSANNYVVTPELFGENPFTFITKIKINSQNDGNMILVANDSEFVPSLYLQQASKTLTVYNGTSYTGNTVIPVDTWYLVKLEWDGEALKWYTAPYVENSYFEPAWTLENSITENLFNVKKSYRIGSPDSTTSYYLHGLVDLKATKYYENNELVWQALKEV